MRPLLAPPALFHRWALVAPCHLSALLGPSAQLVLWVRLSLWVRLRWRQDQLALLVQLVRQRPLAP